MIFDGVSRITLNPPNATIETLCYMVGFPKLGHIIMALTVNSLLLIKNILPYGRKLLVMQLASLLILFSFVILY